MRLIWSLIYLVKVTQMKFFLIILCLIIPISISAAQDTTYGNLVVSKIRSVYDGDTFRADIAGVHPIIGHNVSIRIYGVDTPEIRGECPSEKVKAKNAQRFVEQALRLASTVELRNVRRDKYFRLNADVYVDGRSISAILIKHGMAYPYFGKTKQNWCEL